MKKRLYPYCNGGHPGTWLSRGSSPVGKQGGEQVIKLTYDCSERTIAHEMLHALGFWHEQSRYDRDSYIVIDTSNVATDHQHNFQIEPGSPVSALRL